MEQRRGLSQSCIMLSLKLCLAVSFCFMQCDARKVAHWSRRNNHIRTSMKSNVLERFGIAMPVLKDTSNTQPYVSSPLSMTPYQSLPPFPFPDNAPPSCVTPPFTPQPPSSVIPTPSGGFPPLPPFPPSSPTPALPGQNPPSSTPETVPTPYPPCIVPSPPTTFPNPPNTVPSPPEYTPIAPPANVPNPPFYEPSPPSYTPSPTVTVPSPPDFVPSPMVTVPSPPDFVPSPFLPPVVYPPPAVPPPPHTVDPKAMWCVAKPSVPEPITQEAMNYACASGIDCDQIKQSGSCFQPDTVLAHASYAFNSYWQRTKAAGGTCEFGGSAILVTEDPSYDGCHFLYF
ncbi:hypothetical protein Leryth_026006 [Lithospermum erythrorhizon]|nr:hypothetical protein Leryth_026006 [Lithospermum erythrorhizon]